MMADSQNLGIGSRVKHHDYGDGVVVNVKPLTYNITFIGEGHKELSRFQHNLEIIDGVEPPEDLISNAELEKTLISILRRWTEMPEHVSLAGKWSGGKMIMQPGDTNMQGKEIP